MMVHKKKLIASMATVMALMLPAAYADQDKTLDIDISSKSADLALMELAREAGVQIVLSSDTSDSIVLPSISGEYTLSQALEMMLKGSGLTYKYTSDMTLLVSKEPEGNEEEENKDVEEEILVVGSRLKNIATGSNTVVITREEIKQQGFGNVEDVIRSLTQNFSDINEASALDNFLNTRDAAGQSAANLRGLGAGSTLILVNGRRWAQSATFGDGTVNLNGIPFSAVERVEILLDGASAVYGADAVGGVINFVLRDSFQGGETIARYELTRNGGDSFKIEQNASIGWSSGRALLTLNYTETDPVDDSKLFESSDFRPLGGSDRRTTNFGQPGVVSGMGALPKDDDGTNGIAGRLSVDNIVPFDSRDNRASTSIRKGISSRLHVRQEVTDSVTAFVELLYTDNTSSRVAGAPRRFNTLVPTTNPYNDLDVAVRVNYQFIEEVNAGILPVVSTPSDQESTTYTLGFDTDFFDNWTMDFTATFSEQEAFFGEEGFENDLFNERVAGFRDANDNGTMDPGEELPIEQVINLFGNGTAQNPEALEGIYGQRPDQLSLNISENHSYLLTFRGNLFEMPAGDVGAVFGTEYRIETLNYAEDPSRASSFLTVEPQRDIQSFFTEIGLPLVGEDQNLPGVESLDLKIAVRHDTYEFEGPFNGIELPFVDKEFTNTSPKVDISWQVIPQLRVRASWSESFLPPRTRSLFAPINGPFNFLPLVDPQNPELGTQFPDIIFRGNPDLQPEISKSLSFGFDWTPGGMLEGLSLSATYTDLDIRDRIAGSTPLLFLDPERFFSFPGIVERDSEGNLTTVNLGAINIAQRLSEAVDATIRYDFDTALGSFGLGLNGTYVSSLQDTFIENSNPQVLDGSSSGPERLKVRGNISWFRDNMSANIYANYSSSYNMTSNPASQRVHHYVTFDVNGVYNMDETGWKFNAGVRNLFNRSFPFFDGPEKPWDPRRVNIRGRIVYFEASKSYDIF